ncbi:MAG: bactofilin family protein [Longimicrobiales bacterium]
MSKSRSQAHTSPEAVISIVGPGMRIIGDCETSGTIRVEGTVEGSVRAAKAVVIGKDGTVRGDINTQDAVISGNVIGTLVVESRLELQGTCKIEGEIHATRLQLEEGAVLNGTINMGGKGPGATKASVSAGGPAKEPEPVGAP